MYDKDYKTKWATWEESGFKKYPCPSCGQRTFVPLVKAETGEIIDATQYGKCDREFKCNYSKRKSGNETVFGTYYYENNYEFTTMANKSIPDLKPSLIRKQIRLDSIEGWTTNNLVLYLWSKTKFDYEKICDKVYEYQVGTSTHRYSKGACIFWQTDISGDTRTGKVIQYDEDTGKRIKNLDLPVRWFHKMLKITNYNLKQCLFGEHLLKNKSMPVAIVESEKTAFIQSLADNNYIWLATGGKQNLDRANGILMGRDVTVFPDIDAEDWWYTMALKYDWKFQSVRNIMNANGYAWDSDDDIADMTLWLKRK